MQERTKCLLLSFFMSIIATIIESQQKENCGELWLIPGFEKRYNGALAAQIAVS